MEPIEVTTNRTDKKEKSNKRKELYKKLLQQNKQLYSSDENSESSASHCAQQQEEISVKSNREDITAEKKPRMDNRAGEDARIDEYFSNSVVKKVEVSEDVTEPSSMKNVDIVEPRSDKSSDHIVNLKRNKNEIDWTFSTAQTLVTDLECACSPFQVAKISSTQDWPQPRKKPKLEGTKMSQSSTQKNGIIEQSERYIDLTEENDEDSSRKLKFVNMNVTPCDSSSDGNIDKLQRLSNLSESMRSECDTSNDSPYKNIEKPLLPQQPNRVHPYWNNYNPNFNQGINYNSNNNVPNYNRNGHMQNPNNFYYNPKNNQRNTNQYTLPTRDVNPRSKSVDAVATVKKINSAINKYGGNYHATNTTNYSQNNQNYQQTYKGAVQPSPHMKQSDLANAQKHAIQKNIAQIKENARQYALGLATGLAPAMQAYNPQNPMLAQRQQLSQQSSQTIYTKTSKQSISTGHVTHTTNQHTNTIFQNNTAKSRNQIKYSSNSANINNNPVTTTTTINSYAAQSSNKVTHLPTKANISNKPLITTTTTHFQQKINQSFSQNGSSHHRQAYQQILHDSIPTTYTNKTQNNSSILAYNNMNSSRNSTIANNLSNTRVTNIANTGTITVNQETQNHNQVSYSLNRNNNSRGAVHNHVTVNINLAPGNFNRGGNQIQFQNLNRLQDFLRSITSSSPKNA